MAAEYRPTVPWIANRIAQMTGAEVGRVDVIHPSGKIEYARKARTSTCVLPATAAKLKVPGSWGCRWWEHVSADDVQAILDRWFMDGIISVGPKGNT